MNSLFLEGEVQEGNQKVCINLTDAFQFKIVFQKNGRK